MKYILSIMCMLLLSACGTGKTQIAVGDTEVITHIMGETAVPISPQRIIALTGEATEALLALGIKPIAAVSSYTPDLSWYPHIADQMEGVEIIGNERQVNLEKVAILKPDLIIGIKARQENIYPMLNKIAPTVYVENFYGDWKGNFLTVAKAVGHEEDGQSILTNWTTNMLVLRSKLQKSGVLNKTTALYRFTGKTARYYGNLGFASSIIKELGFKRPINHDKDEFSFEVTQELIPEMNAEQAFYFIFADQNTRAAYDHATNFISNPLFKNLDHKAEDIYEVNNNIWNKSYGIIAAQLVLDEIEAIFFKK
ncbi:MAG: ABC transporter substrate-binding protein [Brevinema sp.]